MRDVCGSALYTSSRHAAAGASLQPPLLLPLSVASQIFNFFMMLTWLSFESKRKQIYVLMFSINVFALTCSFALTSMVTRGHPSRIGCVNEQRGQEHDEASRYCSWQGAFMHILSVSITAWWSYVHTRARQSARSGSVK
jgi:hypothetical protein